MSDIPSPSELRVAVGISQSYASMILSGARRPAIGLAINILRKTNWRHPMLGGLTDDQLVAMEKVEAWRPDVVHDEASNVGASSASTRNADEISGQAVGV